MADENQTDIFHGLRQLAANDQIREALDPVKCLTGAAQIRTQADRMDAAARGLAVGKTASVMTAIEEAKGTFVPMEGRYRGICGMLAGMAEKELAANFTLTMPADRRNAEAHFWRSRVLADMLAASSYYKVTAELISLAIKTLDKCSPSMKAAEIALLLDHASTLLGDAAKFMGTAGAELGDNAARWKTLEEAVKQL
jgi:hypothetical protein